MKITKIETTDYGRNEPPTEADYEATQSYTDSDGCFQELVGKGKTAIDAAAGLVMVLTHSLEIASGELRDIESKKTLQKMAGQKE